jgi:hypothetical protein
MTAEALEAAVTVDEKLEILTDAFAPGPPGAPAHPRAPGAGHVDAPTNHEDSRARSADQSLECHLGTDVKEDFSALIPEHERSGATPSGDSQRERIGAAVNDAQAAGFMEGTQPRNVDAASAPTPPVGPQQGVVATPTSTIQPLPPKDIRDLLHFIRNQAGFETGAQRPPVFDTKDASPFGTAAHKSAADNVLPAVQNIYPEAQRIVAEPVIVNGVIQSVGSGPGGAPKGSHVPDVLVLKVPPGPDVPVGKHVADVGERIGDYKYGGGTANKKFSDHGLPVDTFNGRTQPALRGDGMEGPPAAPSRHYITILKAEGLVSIPIEGAQTESEVISDRERGGYGAAAAPNTQSGQSIENEAMQDGPGGFNMEAEAAASPFDVEPEEEGAGVLLPPEQRPRAEDAGTSANGATVGELTEAQPVVASSGGNESKSDTNDYSYSPAQDELEPTDEEYAPAQDELEPVVEDIPYEVVLAEIQEIVVDDVGTDVGN